MTVLSWLFLALAAGSAAYSLIALLAVIRFLRERRKAPAPADYSPAVSLLKPLYGLEPQLRANLESFCRQDYPAYEILFSVRDESDPAAAVVRRLQKDFPRIPMRLLVTGPPACLNAKVHALELMAESAAHEILVINDSGVRVPPGYLRAVAQPFANPATGLVTCIARSLPARGFWSILEALGVNTQFNPGVLTAWLLLGMRFAIGKTMAVRKKIIGQLGGFGSLGQYLADDFVLGERVAQAGHDVVLLGMTPDNLLTDAGMRNTLAHRLRWERSSRRSRPVGYLGQLFLHNLPLALLAWLFVPPGSSFASGIIAACLATRFLLAWVCAGVLLRDPTFRKYWWLLPVQDVVSFGVWLWAFLGRGIVWRGARFTVQKGGILKKIRL